MKSFAVVVLLVLAAHGKQEVTRAREVKRNDMNLVCPPCHQIHCAIMDPADLDCEGGVTTGVCGCCPVCARLAGQPCGGDLSYLGKCDRGLTCLSPAPSTRPPLPRHPLQRAEPGVCTREREVTSQQSDAATSRKCRPKCSIGFCARNPRAICSASSVANPLRPCQGTCQHTSCRACALEEESECVRCAGHDFRCLKQFGRCVSRRRCREHARRECRQLKAKVSSGQRLVCEVPECPG